MLPYYDQLKDWARKDDMRGFDCLGAEALGVTYTPAPSLADVRAGRQILTFGMKGDSVMYVQGIVGAIADGEYGPATEKAVTVFNDAHGLGHNGVVGAKTMAALDVLAGGQGGVTKIDFAAPSPAAYAPSVQSAPSSSSGTKSTALVPVSANAAPNWWTQPAWQGTDMKRWQVAAAGAGGATVLGVMFAWLVGSAGTVTR